MCPAGRWRQPSPLTGIGCDGHEIAVLRYFRTANHFALAERHGRSRNLTPRTTRLVRGVSVGTRYADVWVDGTIDELSGRRFRNFFTVARRFPNSLFMSDSPPTAPSHVIRAIRRLDLCSPEAVDTALAEGGEVIAALDSLVRTGHLTTFQADCLKSGETAWLGLGDYRPQYLISAGSFARVFRGVRTTDNKTAAIKVMRERWIEKPTFVELFRKEGELGQRLTHRNIVPTWEVGEDNGKPFIAMDFVEGGNLRDVTKARSKFSPADTMKVGMDVCAGLEYALKFGIGHRDIKPTNILLGTDGTAKLIDFGLAGDDSDETSESDADKQTALEYLTIERAFNVRNDPRSDLYFLGATLFELITGEPPYVRTGDRAERKRIGRYRDIDSVRVRNAEVPRPVAAIIDQLLDFDPGNRFQTPTDTSVAMAEALVAIGGGGAKIAGAVNSDGQALKTVLCVESRPKHQDRLRQYFSKHNFRVLVMGDASRAVSRLKTSPPDSIILMGDAIGPEVAEAYADIVQSTTKVACVAVLGKNQTNLANQMQTGSVGDCEHGAVLVQPVTPRKLRETLVACLEAV